MYPILNFLSSRCQHDGFTRKRPLWGWMLLPGLLLQGGAQAACNTTRISLLESTPDTAFIDNGDGTVTHRLTGLTWDRCAWGLTWDGSSSCTGRNSFLLWKEALDAVVTANANSHRGYSDWRLPNQRELASIVETCSYAPAINFRIFPDTSKSYFWSSSTFGFGPGLAWVVDFLSGSSTANDKRDFAGLVRLVRGGQLEDGFDLLNPPSLVTNVNAELAKPSTSNKGFSGMPDAGYPVESSAGVYQFTATFCASGSNQLAGLFSQTRSVSTHASLISRDRDGAPVAGGAGSEQDFLTAGDYADGILATGECVDIRYRLGLAKRKRFSFFVDIMGTASPPAAR